MVQVINPYYLSQLCHPVRPTPVRMEELVGRQDQRSPALVLTAAEERLVQVRKP